MPNTRCEQDLVGFNPQNTGAVLQIGVPTVVNNALVIDTTATPNYSGSVQLSIGDELGMTATFVESGTTTLTKTVVAGQVLYIPLRVTANDCGYDRCGYWQFTVYYEANPDYGNNTGGEDPDPCGKPGRLLKVCRFDARWPNNCYANFEESLINVSGVGTLTTRFNLGQSPQCTGPVKVTFSTECEGLDFNVDQPGIVPPDVTCDPIIQREPEVALGNGNINSPIYIDYLNEVWVSGDSVNDEIQRFDATTYAILPPISLSPGDTPVGMIYLDGGLNKVYVALGGANNVAIIDTNTLAVTTITGSIGTGPLRFTWVTEPGVNEVWVTCFGSDNVYRIDVLTDTVVEVPISVQTQPNDILFTGNGKVYVASLNTNMVVIDTTSYAVTTVSGTSSVFRMAMSGSTIYCRANNVVYRVNSNTSAVIDNFSVPGNGGLAYMPGNGFFILNQSLNLMYLYNEDTSPALLNTYTTGLSPREVIIEPVANQIYVSDFGTGEVTPYTTRACANPIVYSPSNRILEVELPYSYGLDYFDLSFNYSSDKISCYCSISAVTEYASCNNPNLIGNAYNNGTLSGFVSQAQFNSAGIYARASTAFSVTINPVAGTALRITIDSPVDYTNRPLPGAPVTPPLTISGSIIWQGDPSQPFNTPTGERYWLRCKARVLNPLHLIKANEEVHLDRYFVVGNGQFNPAIPYFTQYTPAGQWHDIGIRWQATGFGASISPFVRYVNTFASGPNTLLVGDLYLNDGASSDWANIELTRYYPADCIECPTRVLTIKNRDCDYVTELELDITSECETVDLKDTSDFGFTPGHDRADFTLYRKVTVTLPNGQQQILSSIVPYNILIDAPANGILTPFYSGYPITMGGVYTFTMCNIPTFRNDVAYQVGDNVILVDSLGAYRFFVCTQSSPGKTPLVVTGWQNYWQEIQENEFNSKYCDTQTYINLCALRRCIREYQNKLICSLKEICQNNLCENECLKNYFMLQQMLLIMESDNPETDEPYWSEEEVNLALNLANKLCQTCNCQ